MKDQRDANSGGKGGGSQGNQALSVEFLLANSYKDNLYKAQNESVALIGEKLTPRFDFSSEEKLHDPKEIKALLVEAFLAGVTDHSGGLVGSCFMMVRDASYVLHKNRFRHTLTIGNVLVDGKPYYETTPDSLRAEIHKGYVANKPAIAHAWLTLDSGQIVDLTILASLAHAVRREEDCIGLANAILVSLPDENSSIRHLPMLTGFGYHIRVVSHYLDNNFGIYMQWLLDYHNLWEQWGNEKVGWR